MDKRLFLERTIEEVRSLDISQVIGRYLRLEKRGRSYLAICPFHNDRSLGSFIITPSKGIFKCFACGVGGDAAKFVAEYTGANYVEATFEIALREGIISQGDYDKYLIKRRYNRREVKNIEKIYVKKDKNKFKVDKASIEVLDKVYSIFLNTLSLKKEHIRHLEEVRKLPKGIIKKRRYKSSQYATKKFMERFLTQLKKGGIELSSLKKIPGFFQKYSKKRGWYWTFPYYKGIFIPILDYKGRIRGLQVRVDKKQNGSGRYFWFSSSFAEHTKNQRYGTSSKSPLDIIYPEGRPARTLFITEGRFKSEILTKSMNSVAISIQGVSNWRGIEWEISQAEKMLKDKYSKFKGFTHICIAFDSDMKYNYQVYKQLKAMSDCLKKKTTNKKILYLHWDEKHKGIDDLFLSVDSCKTANDYGRLLSIYKKRDWDKQYQSQLKKIMKFKKASRPEELDEESLQKIKIS